MAACHLLGVLSLVLLSFMALVGLAWPNVIKQKELEKHARSEGVVFSFPASEIVSHECTLSLGRCSTARRTASRKLVSPDCKIDSARKTLFVQCPSDKKESFFLNLQSTMSIELEESLKNCGFTVRIRTSITIKISRRMFSNEGSRSLIALCSESLSVYKIPVLRSNPCSLFFPRKVIEISPPRYAAAGHKFGFILCLDPSRLSARRSLLSSEKVADPSNYSELISPPDHPLPLNLSTAFTDKKSASTTAYSLQPPNPPQPTGVHP
ncbi:hypothetical protein O6H91_13G058900 [Diphasiastrum complanatum]|uniref:Uncharacterized protein n=1 Tax=Diphasiastrum complanatum TaxID=34168 RepID=A0ACC2BV59_DIPCM|nr:hypothetical protein O6H91_13G058900 [Diphasiastrum complanatum]